MCLSWGALIGIVLNPYDEKGPILNLVQAAAVQLVLLAPILSHYFRRRAYLVLSVSDAFLLAFAIGFGFDFLGEILGSGGFQQWYPQFRYFPASVIKAETFIFAGHAYWTGLLALSIASAWRFLANRWMRWGVVAFSSAWVLAEVAVWRGGASLKVVFSPLTFNGALTGWYVLALAVGMAFVEQRWIRGTLGAVTRSGPWQSLASMPLAQFVRQFPVLERRHGLATQIEIGTASLRQDPGDKGLPRTLAAFRARQAAGEAVPDAPASPNRKWWFVLDAFCVLCVLAICWWPQASSWFWSLSLLHGSAARALTLTRFQVVLIGILFWRGLTAAPRPRDPEDADDLLQFGAEVEIRRICCWIALLTCTLYPFSTPGDPPPAFSSWRRYYPFHGVSSLLPLHLPDLYPWQISTLFLLLATLISSLMLRRSAH